MKLSAMAPLPWLEESEGYDPRSWLDPADLVSEDAGLIPDDAPTTRDVSGPSDRGRRA